DAEAEAGPGGRGVAVALVLRLAHALEPFGQGEGVAVVTAGRDAVAAGGGVPAAVGPFNGGGHHVSWAGVGEGCGLLLGSGWSGGGVVWGAVSPARPMVMTASWRTASRAISHGSQRRAAARMPARAGRGSTSCPAWRVVVRLCIRRPRKCCGVRGGGRGSGGRRLRCRGRRVRRGRGGVRVRPVRRLVGRRAGRGCCVAI